MERAPCKRCGGTGFVIVEHEDISGAQRCACSGEARTASLEAESGLPSAYANSTFDRFKCFDDPRLKHIFRMCSNWARDFTPGTQRNGLMLVGGTGTGKTHLATAALRQVLANGIDGKFFDYQTLLDSIRAGYDPTSNQSDREAYKTALEAEVVVLDDLGAHRVTDWVDDTVTSIITSRCNNRKALIVTTNLPCADLGDWSFRRPDPNQPVEYRTMLHDRIGPRAYSRLFEMCAVFRMPDIEDYRKRPHQAAFARSS